MEFTSFWQAMDVYVDPRKKGTPEHQRAARYVFENAPPELQEEFASALFEAFPDLVPSLVNETTGEMFFDFEQLCRITGIPREDVEKELKETGKIGYFQISPGNLIRVQ